MTPKTIQLFSFIADWKHSTASTNERFTFSPGDTKIITHSLNVMILGRDRNQILLLILREFKPINYFLFPLKS